MLGVLAGGLCLSQCQARMWDNPAGPAQPLSFSSDSGLSAAGAPTAGLVQDASRSLCSK